MRLDRIGRFVSPDILILGLLVFIPGAAVLIAILCGLEPGDSIVALAPLTTMRLEGVTTTQDLIIPNDRQWKRIRRVWGEPELVISTVSAERFAYCITALNLAVTVTDQGKQLPLEASGPAYSYSTDCATSSLRFRAAPGAKLRLTVTRTSDRPLPTKQVVVVYAWSNTKDNLVGEGVKGTFIAISVPATLLGLTLIVLAFRLR